MTTDWLVDLEPRHLRELARLLEQHDPMFQLRRDLPAEAVDQLAAMITRRPHARHGRWVATMADAADARTRSPAWVSVYGIGNARTSPKIAAAQARRVAA